MKNTIIIDAKNSCACDLVSIVGDGTNSLYLEIHADVSKNPKLELPDTDIAISSDIMTVQIGSSFWAGTGTLQFRIADDGHAGEYFSVAKVEDLGGDVYLAQIDNFNYELFVSKPNTTGIPIATDKDLGVVRGGDNVHIRSDGQMYIDGLMSSADKEKLDAFGDASTYALKSDITNMYRYKGSVANASKLPTSGQAAGDVYNIESASDYGGAGMNVAWNGSAWDPLGEIFTITPITNAEIDSICT